jgi:hypothetical protein
MSAGTQPALPTAATRSSGDARTTTIIFILLHTTHGSGSSVGFCAPGTGERRKEGIYREEIDRHSLKQSMGRAGCRGAGAMKVCTPAMKLYTTAMKVCTLAMKHSTHVMKHCTPAMKHCTRVMKVCTASMKHRTQVMKHCTRVMKVCTAAMKHSTPAMKHCTPARAKGRLVGKPGSLKVEAAAPGPAGSSQSQTPCGPVCDTRRPALKASFQEEASYGTQ